MILTDCNKIKIGNSDILAVYAGDAKIWPAETGNRLIMRFTTTDGNTWNKDNISAYTADNRLIEPIEKTATGWTYEEDVKYLASAEGSTMGKTFNLLTFNGFGGKIKINSGHNMFYGEANLTEIDTKYLDVSEAVDFSYMFGGCNNLTTLNVSNFDTSKAVGMWGMFDGCTKLLSLDLSKWKTSNVTQMRALFKQCNSLTSLDLSNWDTSKVRYMTEMFYGCSSLASLDLSSFNTSNVTHIGSMFAECRALISLDLSNFNVYFAEDLRDFFFNCQSLETLDLSNWKIKKDIDVSNMFYRCNALKTITMKNCSQDTIDKIKAALTDAGILDNVQIIVSEKPTELHYVYTEDDVIYYTAINTTVSTKFRVKGKLRGRMEGGFYVGHQGNDDADDFRLFMPFDTLKWMFDCGESRFTDVFGATKDGDLFDITCGNNYIINNLTQERQEGDVQTNIADVSIKLRLPFAYTNSLQIWQGEELVFDASVSDDLKFIDNLTGTAIENSEFIFI